MNKDKLFSHNIINEYIKEWRKKYPENYPLVTNIIQRDTHISMSRINAHLNSIEERFEPESYHHIRLTLDSLYELNNTKEFIRKKDLILFKLNNNTSTVNYFFRDNPEYKEKFDKHNKIVSDYKKSLLKEYHKEYAITYQPEYNKKNREKINKWYRDYYANPETGYREKHLSRIIENKEEINKRRKKYYEENKEEIKKKAKEYYLKNKKKINKRIKENYQKNRLKILEDYKNDVNGVRTKASERYKNRKKK